MDCNMIMAVLIDKRTKEAVRVQQVLTKHGCIIKLRLGLHETANFCAENGLVLLALCGTREEVAALKRDLVSIKGVKAKTLTL